MGIFEELQERELIAQITNEQEVQKTVSEIKENTKDWTYFLDGQEVSFENIDLDQYNISYDKGKNKVFLSKK